MESSEKAIKQMEMMYSSRIAYRCSLCLEFANDGQIKLAVSLSNNDNHVIVVICSECSTAFYINKDYLDIGWTVATITVTDVGTYGNLKSRKETNFRNVKGEAWADFMDTCCVFYDTNEPEI